MALIAVLTTIELLAAAFKRNPPNVAIACAVIVMGIVILFGRERVAQALLKFYERPSDEALRWFEKRPNPSPFQVKLMAFALGLASTALGVSMLVMTLIA